MQDFLSAEYVESLNLQNVAHNRTAYCPAVAGNSVLGIVVTDVEFAEV